MPSLKCWSESRSRVCLYTWEHTGRSLPSTDLASQCTFGFESHEVDFSWGQSCPKRAGVVQIRCYRNVAVWILPRIRLAPQRLKGGFCLPVLVWCLTENKQSSWESNRGLLSRVGAVCQPALLLSTAQLQNLPVWNAKLLGRPFSPSSLASQSVHSGKEWKLSVCLLLKTFQTFTYLHLE